MMRPFDLLKQLPASLVAQVPLDDLPEHMIKLLARALNIRRAELWIVVNNHLCLAASWPTNQPFQIIDPTISISQPIFYAGLQVGRLHLDPVHAYSVSTIERSLISAYADQAGLVLAMHGRRQSLLQQETALEKRSTELQLSRSWLLAAERNERRRIERDLHDGAQQHLIALGVMVNVARAQLNKPFGAPQTTLQQAGELARRATKDLRALSHSLYPDHLERDNLEDTIYAAIASVPTGVLIDINIRGTGFSVNATARASIYFLLIEATQNAIKHGSANSIFVNVEDSPGFVMLTIADDGGGFDPALAVQGVGLQNITTRVRDLHGQANIETLPGGGTTIQIILPKEFIQDPTAGRVIHALD